MQTNRAPFFPNKSATNIAVQMAAFAFLALLGGCGGHGRALVVKSDPADSEVCIKGKAHSDYFNNQKSCIGTTPFEARKAGVLDPEGQKRDVKFSDVESDRESFYVIVSHPGYISEVLEVPDPLGQWEFQVKLKSEQAAVAAQLAAVNPPLVPITVGPNSSPTPANAPQTVAGIGTVRLTSEPNGALVYVNGALRGNTPFSYEGRGGETVAFKLELDGYKMIEKNFTVESQKSFVINFRMQALGGASVGDLTAPSPPASGQ